MKNESEVKAFGNNRLENILAIVAIGLVGLNLYGLFTRLLLFNVVATAFLCAGAWLLVKKMKGENVLFKKMVSAGSYLLLLGLFVEDYEGGIKKDPSTYSYYFVTSGLAYYMLVCFTVLTKRKYWHSIINYFALNGKNPMVAYVAGSLLLLPLLTLTHIKPYWDQHEPKPFAWLFKRCFVYGHCFMVTVFFVKKKWFWKT